MFKIIIQDFIDEKLSKISTIEKNFISKQLILESKKN